MHARFLLGPAGSGKTSRCLAEIRSALADAPEGPPLVLLAPKQATYQLERQLLAAGSLSGYTRLHIFSFERLAQFVLNQLAVAPPKLLSDNGRVMVLRALLLRHADELKLFKGSARRPGFARELGGQLHELQQYHVNSANLRALAQIKGRPDALRDKLHDLALISEKYAGWLRDHELQDASCLLDFTADALQKARHLQPSIFNFSALWLDGFAEMTPQELDFLAAVIPACDRATLAFCLDDSVARTDKFSWLSMWSADSQSFQQCHLRLAKLPDCHVCIEHIPRHPMQSRFAKSDDLQFLEAGWARPPVSKAAPIPGPPSCISVVACPDAGAEAAFAAREILRFVRAGNRFCDCAVLVRNLESHHKPLQRAFQRCGIPFFLDRRERVAHHPLAELTRSALRTVAFDWQHDDWFAALKAGFAPCSEDEIDRLENESLARGWRGRKWLNPITISENPELEKTLERLRQKIIPPFENFAKRLARHDHSPDGTRLAEALRELWAGLKAESVLEHWTRDLKNPAIHPTVWSQMNTWLDNLVLAFAQEPLPLRDWMPVLEAGLAELTIGVVPPTLDQVLIGAVDRARNPDLKFTCVLGVNEALFPAAPSAPMILTDTDRNQLTLRLGPNLREQLARERYYGYIACTRAGEKLVLTRARHDTEGKALNPSPFIAHIQRIFPRLEEREFSGDPDWREAEHAGELVKPLIEINQLKSEAKNWGTLLEIPALKSLAEKLAQLREPEVTENLAPAFAGKLYGPVLNTSVSRLEEFAQCPFKFFVRVGLRADERKVFELDARERGTFQHEVLKMFHESLVAENRRWRDLTPVGARERIAVIAAGLAQSTEYRDGLLRDTAQAQFEARTLTSALQDFVEAVVTWMHRQYEFDPAVVELGFGVKNAPAPAWMITLLDDRRLALRGRIDRVDLCRVAGAHEAFAVVLDYKSSGKSLERILIENGLQLQLLAYLAALRRWPDPQKIFQVSRLIPVGTFYVNLRGDHRGGGTRDEILAETMESRQKAYQHTGRFDAGMLPQLDRAGAEDQFRYRLNKNGSQHKGSKEAMPHPEFEKLLDDVEVQLRRLGERIFAGEARVDPYRKGRQTPCEHCDYQAACRIDKGTHPYRVLHAISGPDG